MTAPVEVPSAVRGIPACSEVGDIVTRSTSLDLTDRPGNRLVVHTRSTATAVTGSPGCGRTGSSPSPRTSTDPA